MSDAPRENVRAEPGDAARGEIELLDESVVWTNGIVQLCNGRVRFPADEHGRHGEGEHFRLAPARGKAHGVVAAPILPDGRILLVRQFRHPVRMWLRELPRGTREAGESPEDAVRRELREEVGCDVESLVPLGRVAPDSGQLDALPHLFAARVRRVGEREPERSEAIDRVIPHGYTELRRACERGEILDGLTIAVVLRLAPCFEGDRFVGPRPR